MTGAPYQLLPDPAPDDLRRLTESIRANGIEVPVVVDEDGNILDGHHRQMIADSLGLECPRVIKRGLNEDQKRIYAVEMNLARRQLTGAQKVLLGKKIEPNIAAEAKARMQHKDPKTGENTYGQSTVGVGSHPQTRDEVAGKVGVGAGVTYQRHKKVLDELANEPDGAQLMEHIESGDWDIKDAREELKRRHNPSPPKDKPAPIYEVPTGMSSISSASAMLELAELVTANIAESGDYLFDMAQDIDAYLDSLPKIISTMKRVARRARHLRDKAISQQAA